MNNLKTFAILWAAGLLCLAGQAGAQGLNFGGNSKPAVSAKLIADKNPAAPGEPFRLGVLYTLEPTWHIYWENPGDAGFPTMIDLETPEGFELGEVQWPAPHRYEAAGGILTYGYAKSVVLWMDARLPPGAEPGSTIELSGESQWLECDPLTCVPGESSLKLSLEVAAESKLSADAARMELAASRTPNALDLSEEGSPLSAALADGWLELRGKASGPLKKPALEHQGRHLEFFTRNPDQFGQGEASIGEDGSFLLRLPPGKRYKKGPAVSGVLVVPDAGSPAHGFAAFDLRFDPSGGGGAEASAAKARTPGSKAASGAKEAPAKGEEASSADGGGVAGQDFTKQGLGSAATGGLLALLGVAFLGGLILNVMPCVLPVISLKILGLARQGAEEPGRVFKLGLVFALGIWVSFMALAIPLMAVRAAGEKAGWGLIFQSPDFNLFLYGFLVVFGLSLLGAFEMPIPGFAQSAAGGAGHKEGYAGAFVNGCLAVALATPCMGPFIGPAVGVALTQSAGNIPLIFSAIALGLAFPYIVLSANPGWTKFLPKPGEWMVNVKLLMGLAMIGAAIFPFSVLAGQHGKLLLEAFEGELIDDPVSGLPAMLLLFAATVSLAVLIMGKFVGLATPRGKRWFARALGLGLIAGGYWLFLATPMWSLRTGELPETIKWEKFSPSGLQERLDAGESVFIDFTADWCISCKVNEKAFIDTEPVRDILARPGLTAMKADWTRRDDDITEMLSKFGRAGVPFYVVFPASDPENPIVLPDAITTGILVDALKRAAK